MVYPSSSPTNTTWLFSSIFVVVFVVSFFSGSGGQPYAKMQLASSRRQRSFLFVVREVLPQRILTWPSIPLFSLDPAVRIEMLQHHLRFEDLFQSFLCVRSYFFFWCVIIINYYYFQSFLQFIFDKSPQLKWLLISFSRSLARHSL